MQQDAAAPNSKKSEFIFCAHCGTRNPENDYSCSRCGERLYRPNPDAPPPMGLVACQKCNTPNVARASYCISCGSTLETPVRVSPAATAQATQRQGPAPRQQAEQRGRYDRQPEPRRAEPRPAETAPRPPERTAEAALSGRPDAQLPPQLRRFNWGAFLLGPLWGIGNGVWPAVVIGLAGAVVPWFTRSNPWLGFAVVFAADLLIGFKANEWAWKARKWQSVDQFRRVQQSWLLWGVILTVITVLVLMLFGQGLGTADVLRGE